MFVETRGGTAIVAQISCDGDYVLDFVFFFTNALAMLDCTCCQALKSVKRLWASVARLAV